eukprot:6176490-Pleurochrysis_carterae.AAC.1
MHGPPARPSILGVCLLCCLSLNGPPVGHPLRVGCSSCRRRGCFDLASIARTLRARLSAALYTFIFSLRRRCAARHGFCHCSSLSRRSNCYARVLLRTGASNSWVWSGLRGLQTPL